MKGYRLRHPYQAVVVSGLMFSAYILLTVMVGALMGLRKAAAEWSKGWGRRG